MLDQDLSYDESLSGQPGAWLVKRRKKNYMHAITKLSKRPDIEIKNVFHNIFHFHDNLYN